MFSTMLGNCAKVILLPICSLIVLIGSGAAQPSNGHLDNPYIGADRYINPDYAHEVEYSIAHSHDPTLQAQMRRIQSMPTAIWLDRIEAIDGGKKNNQRLSLEQHLTQALAQQTDKPMLLELVLYNLPNRDCSALSSNGTLDFRKDGIQRYQTAFIDRVADILQQPRFQALRFVLILEPDSLPNMITNLWHKTCSLVQKNHVYEQSLSYAIQRLSQKSNNYIYMDIAHSGWLGWDENRKKAVAYYKDVIQQAHSPKGLHAIDGFITNVSGSTPNEEPFLSNPDQIIGDKPLKAADFYGWNSFFDEKDYIETLYHEFTAAGLPQSTKFLIDTSRNGWGGESRPQHAAHTVNLNDLVQQSRVDRRFHRGNWCNPSGAGLGARPIAIPYGEHSPIAAFVWVKPPGESDGTSNPNQSQADKEGKRYDPMCDPNYIVDFGPSPSYKPTGALADAPASGHWFHKQFVMLIEHAYPSVKTSKK